jgi:hypothetical protein
VSEEHTAFVATADSQSVEIVVDDATRVSGLLIAPRDSGACFVVAHGAGAGMRHPFMAKLANDLAERRIATLRYQFPYMERQGKRPDARRFVMPRFAQQSRRQADSYRDCH